MKRITLTACMILYVLMGYAQNPGQEFVMKPVEYIVLDNTPYGFARSGSNSRHEDINVSVVLQPSKDKREEQWRCKYGQSLDTLILAIQKNDFFEGGWIDTKKFPNGIAISEYLSDNHDKVNADANTKLVAYTNAVTEHLQREPWVDKDKQRAEQEVRQAAHLEQQQRNRILGNLNYEFVEPMGPIQTNSTTNPNGAKVTYEYYVNENGREVKHGKRTTIMTFKDYTYRVGSNRGFAHLTGTETLTETYRNGILHGPLTYKCNVSSDYTFGPSEDINRTYNLNIYKGFLTGNFTFAYKNITYTGKAVNGILEYCNYRTSDGFHGKLTSNPNGESVSIANINNGYNTFEFDAGIMLQSVKIIMSSFRFPLIGE